MARKGGEVARWDKLAKRVLGMKTEGKFQKAPPLMEVHIAHLRAKLGAAARHLITERNEGLRLVGI